MTATVTIPAKSQVASFDVDAQNCFTPLCPNELPVPEGNLIAAQLNAQANKAALRVGSKDAHSPRAHWIANAEQKPFATIKGNNMDLVWPLHAEVGTKGFELIDTLPAVTDYDYFVWKGIECDMHPYGACYHDFAEKMSTGVIEFLRQQHINTVIVGGLATEYCVKATVMQLHRAGFAVVVNKAAVRGIDPNAVQQSFTEMQNAGIKLAADANHIVNE